MARAPHRPPELTWPRILPTAPSVPIPRLRPQSGAVTQASVLSAVPSQSAKPAKPAKPELKGDGTLFPALVIGLGHLGLGVLAQLQDPARALRLPGRPAAHPPALPGHRSAACPRGDPGRSERGSGRQRGGRGPPEPADPLPEAGPRPAAPRGLAEPQDAPSHAARAELHRGRARLGRLALIDNYPAISARLQSQLEACTAANALAVAKSKTLLGLRTNRPRVYVVASLAGGTGGGMFIDLAYIVRQQVQQLGYPDPDVVAVLLLPAADPGAAESTAAANAFAALTELNHFSSPEITFTGHYDDRDWPVNDPAAPFRRCVLLPLPPEGRRAGAVNEVVARAGDFLCRDLITPLGRAADDHRAAAAPAPEAPGLTLQTFGLHWISWPGHALRQRVGRRVCHRLVQDWLVKDRPGLRPAVQAWVSQQWAQRQLERRVPGGPPATGLRAGHRSERRVGHRRPRRPGGALGPSTLEPAQAMKVLEQLQQLVGRPDGDKQPPVLVSALNKAAGALKTETERKLAEMAVCMLDAPTFHLAGAMEAVTQVVQSLDEVLRSQQPLCQQLSAKAAETHARIHSLMFDLQKGGGWFGRKAKTASDLAEALRLYPTVRFQALLAQQVLAVCQNMREASTEHLKEIGFCWGRLSDFERTFKEPVVAARSRVEQGAGQYLLPGDCRTLPEAVDRIFNLVTPADVMQLDQKVQEVVQRRFQSLMQVCMSPNDLFKDLDGAMQQQAEELVGSRLGGSDVADVYVKQHPTAEHVVADLAGIFDEAATDAGALRRGPGPRCACWACRQARPPSSCATWPARRCRKCRSCPSPAPTRSSSIGNTRTSPCASAAAGPRARAAYERIASADQPTPHTRIDIFDWLPASDL